MGGTLHGAAVITLDAKGRLSVPTRHREALLDGARTLVLTAHPDGCVLLYPESAWEPVRAKVANFPSFHPQASWWKRLLLGFEEHVAPDASGRVLLAPALRMHAKLEREAMLVGQGARGAGCRVPPAVPGLAAQAVAPGVAAIRKPTWISYHSSSRFSDNHSVSSKRPALPFTSHDGF